jgi:hypothetical protein
MHLCNPFLLLRSWWEGLFLLHEGHQAEAGESLCTALDHGTYSKVGQVAAAAFSLAAETFA